MSLQQFLTTVQTAGLKIDTVYDIGAWQGQWSQNMKNTALADSEFILFEANPAYKEALSKSGFTSLCGTALSNPGRDSVKFYNGSNTGDSYYKETTKYYDRQGHIDLPCMTLDQVREALNLSIPQFIKIDTQGSELDILSGASFLDKVDLIYIECPIIQYNSGAPNIQDYLDFFKKIFFIPVTILEVHIDESTLLQIDIMFMRKETKERIFGPNVNIRPFAY
jgi:FkbM family methyltransferase